MGYSGLPAPASRVHPASFRSPELQLRVFAAQRKKFAWLPSALTGRLKSGPSGLRPGDGLRRPAWVAGWSPQGFPWCEEHPRVNLLHTSMTARA